MYLGPIPPGAFVVFIVWAIAIGLGHRLFGSLGVLIAIVTPPALALIMHVRKALKGEPNE